MMCQPLANGVIAGVYVRNFGISLKNVNKMTGQLNAEREILKTV